MADEIARKATKEPADFWNISTHFDTIRLINTNLNKKCQKEWRLVKNNKTKRNIKLTILPWMHDVSLSRRHYIIINRLIIGHTQYTHESYDRICTSCKMSLNYINLNHIVSY